MKTRTLTFIILLMCFSLLGAIGVQAYWVREAWQAREAQFDQQVNEALTRVVTQLEEKETAIIVKEHFAVASEPDLATKPKINIAKTRKKKKPAPEKTVLPTAEKVPASRKLVFRMVENGSANKEVKILRHLSSDSLPFPRHYQAGLSSIRIDSFRLPTRLNADSLLKNLNYEKVEIVNFSHPGKLDSLFKRSGVRTQSQPF